MRVGARVAGRYRLVERVGAGSNGVVWQAVDEELDRTVALKRALSGDDQLERLRAEARLLARVNHRHIVTLYDVVSDGDELWLVMEYVPARSLADRDVLSAATVARLGAQLADALAALHAEGVLHRDVKPGNVLLVSDDDAKLADFGISRVLAADVTMTGSTVLGGTPGYLAPEVAKGTEPTAAADVFSLGSTLYAAVAGVSPVGDDTENPFLRLRRAAEGRIDLSGVSGPIHLVLTRMLATDPKKRPSAAEARDLLETVARGEAPPVSPARWRGVLVTAGALAVVIGVGAWWVLGSADQPVAAPPTGSPLGDPRTADPCGLFGDVVGLQRFGNSANLVQDEDNFDQCNVIIKRDNGTQADVMAQFAVTVPGSDDKLPREDHGRFQIVRVPSESGSCSRRLLLPDRYEILIQADRHNYLTADVCAMADVATGLAAAVMSRGEIPRRPPLNPRSYIAADACASATSPLFPVTPGIDGRDPQVGFGRWSCLWTQAGSSSHFHIRFGRNPDTPFEGQAIQVAGRVAVVLVADDTQPDLCEVIVDGTKYTDDYGDGFVEQMYVKVEGKWPRDQRCEMAKVLANASFPPR